MERQIFADLRECRACLSCANACIVEHHPKKDILAALHDQSLSRIFIQAGKSGPVPVSCRHCDEPACVDACLTGAMHVDQDTGRVTVAADTCVGCAMCVMACPFGVIAMEQKDDRRTAIKCDLCLNRDTPACVDACPQLALTFCTPEELAKDKRSRLVSHYID